MPPGLSRRHSMRVGLLGRDMPIIVVSTTNRWNLHAVHEGGRTVWGIDGVQGWWWRGAYSGRQSRFVDVNYQIVPFTRQTRSFFSPWPLIPLQPLHSLLPFCPIYPSVSISVLVTFRSKEPDSTEETKSKTKSTYQMCEDKGRRNHGWIPRLDTLKGTETLL